jgi:hypothetical protein
VRIAVLSLGLLLAGYSQAVPIRVEFSGSSSSAVAADHVPTHPLVVELNSLFGGYAEFSGSLTFDSVPDCIVSSCSYWSDVDRFTLDAWLGPLHFTQAGVLRFLALPDRPLADGTVLGGSVDFFSRVRSLGEPVGADPSTLEITLARPFPSGPPVTGAIDPTSWNRSTYTSAVFEFRFIDPEDGQTVFVYGPLSTFRAGVVPEPRAVACLAGLGALLALGYRRARS